MATKIMKIDEGQQKQIFALQTLVAVLMYRLDITEFSIEKSEALNLFRNGDAMELFYSVSPERISATRMTREEHMKFKEQQGLN